VTLEVSARAADSAPVLAGYFDRALEAFAQAAASGAVVRHYALVGHAFSVHYATSALAADLDPALAHLAAPAAPGALTIYAWHGEAAEATPPPAPWEAVPYYERGNVRGYHGPRYALDYDRRPAAFSAVDHDRQIGLYWSRDADGPPFYERAAPFRRLLSAWIDPHGLFVAHAAAVGFARGGALLPGRSGSGKSTTAALCLGSALGYAGDDFSLVQPPEGRAAPHVYSLYNSVKLNREVLDWLPDLIPSVTNPDQLAIEKALAYVTPTWPARVSNGFPLRAILLPRPTSQAATVAHPVAPEAAYKALLPDTLFRVLGPARLITRGLYELVHSVPCYQLDLGTHLPGVPAAIAEVLSAYAP
jgi:hypothetical protein